MRARSALLLVLSMVAMTVSGVVAPRVSAAPVWTLPRQLAASGEDPVIAANRGGDSVAVWGGTGNTVVGSFRSAGGRWSRPAAVSTGEVLILGDLQAVLDDDGQATVSWTTTDGGPNDGDWPAYLLSARGRPDTGWEAPRLVTRYFSWPSPALVLDPAGNASLAWAATERCGAGRPTCTPAEQAAQRLQIRVASRTAQGEWSAAANLGEGTMPALAAGPDRALTVVWTQEPVPGRVSGDIRAATRSPAGTWAPTAVVAAGAGIRAGPALVADAAGRLTAGWRTCLPQSSGASTCDYQAARRPLAGGWSAARTVGPSSAQPLAGDRVPDLAVDGAGRVTAVWSGPAALSASRADPLGVWEAPVRLSGPGTSALSPSLAVGRSGDAVVTWTQRADRATTLQAADRARTGAWATPVRVDRPVGAPRGSDLTASVAAVGSTFTAAFDGHGVLVSDRVDDRIRPTARLLSPTGAVALAPRLRVTWRSEDPVAGVAGVDVRRRAAGFRTGFGPWSLWRRQATAPTGTLRVHPGRSYCFSARALDRAGNLGGWSGARCVATPVDDRALRGTAGWHRARDARALHATVTTSTRRGTRLSLTGVRGRRVWLVATTCPRFGTVSVQLGRTGLRTVSLRSPSVRHQRVLPLARFARGRSGRLTIQVTTSDRPVRVDGLVVAR